jgi:tetratricopeptide (TPR) repeat protein
MLCSENVARSGSKSSAEAQAEARMSVSRMLHALFGGEASVRAGAAVEEYANVLQEDVPDLQGAITNCRLSMYPILRRDWCETGPQGGQDASLLPAPAPGARGTAGEIDQRIAIINDMLAAGDFNGARRLAEQVAAERQGQNRIAAMTLGGTAVKGLALQAGDALLAERAIDYFKQVEVDARQLAAADRSLFLAFQASAYSVAGMLSRDFVRLAEAESYAREALQLEPDSLDASEALGWILAVRGQFTQDRAEFREGISLLRQARIEYERRGNVNYARMLDQSIWNFCYAGGC